MSKVLTPESYLTSLDSPLKPTIEFLRAVILESHSSVSEQIKWNSLSFYFDGSLDAEKEKAYARDIVVINLHRGKQLLLVFPTGNRIEDSTGLIGKNYEDGRKIVEIVSLEDAHEKADAIKLGIANWINQLEQ